MHIITVITIATAASAAAAAAAAASIIARPEGRTAQLGRLDTRRPVFAGQAVQPTENRAEQIVKNRLHFTRRRRTVVGV